MNFIYKKYIGEFFLCLSALSYSFEWYFIRNLHVAELTPLDIVFTRSVFTLIIIISIFSIVNRNIYNFKKLNFHEYKYVSLLSIAMLLCSICFNTAITTTTVTNTLIIFYLCVFWGVIYGFIFLKETTTRKIILYTFFAFIGILLALSKNANSFSLTFGKGELFALFGSLLFPFDAVISRKIKHTNPMQRLLLVNIFTLIISTVSIYFLKDFQYFQKFLSIEVLLYSFLLALFCCFFAKWFMYNGYNRTPVAIALVILLFEPITQMTTAYFMADEKILLINGIGIIIVFAMAILISRNKLKIH